MTKTCNHQSMARSGNNKAIQKTPEVTFSIELRPATPEQIEAGRRIYSRFITRARSNQKQSDTAKARAQAVAGAPPAVPTPEKSKPPHLLTGGL